MESENRKSAAPSWQQEQKILGIIGIAVKAGKAVSGELSVENSVKSGRSCLVLLAADSSPGTKKKFSNMCNYYHIPWAEVQVDRIRLGLAAGKEFRSAVSLEDTGLAKTACGYLR